MTFCILLMLASNLLPAHVAAVTGPGERGPDPSFNGGKIRTDFTTEPNKPSADIASDAALQDDGKIVVVGTSTLSIGGYLDQSTSNFAVTRYNPDGTLDKGFGAEGRVVTDLFERGDDARAVVVQPSGRIVVGGSSLIPWQSKRGFLWRQRLRERHRVAIGRENRDCG